MTRPPHASDAPIFAPFVVAPKPYQFREHVGDTCLVTAAVGWLAPRLAWIAVSSTAVGVHVIPSALALAVAVGAAWVLTDVASRRFATLRVDANSIAVERGWPRVAHTYSWAELQDWRRGHNCHPRGRGGLRVQLRFNRRMPSAAPPRQACQLEASDTHSKCGAAGKRKKEVQGNKVPSEGRSHYCNLTSAAAD